MDITGYSPPTECTDRYSEAEIIMAFLNAWKYGLIWVTNKLDVVENQLTFPKYKCHGFDEVFARFFAYQWLHP